MLEHIKKYMLTRSSLMIYVYDSISTMHEIFQMKGGIFKADTSTEGLTKALGQFHKKLNQP